MGHFNYITPIIYWLLVVIWIYIFVFYIRQYSTKRHFSKLLAVLLFVLAVDALRTLIESLYFGAWYTSLSGIIPIGIYNFLAQPEIVFFPKAINLAVSVLILMILIKKWLPAETARINEQNALIENKTRELNATIKTLQSAKNELLEAKEKAEQSDKLKSAFLSNMSHEIRTPMNGIVGFTELLQESNLSVELQKDYINIIKNSGVRLLNTVNDIIEISQIESGEVIISKSEILVKDFVESLAEFFRPEAEKKNLAFTIENHLPQNDLKITTDENKFSSIVSNLIKNAIKYTNSGSIKIGLKVENQTLVFYCKDTGIGIPKNRHTAIFNRFEQADLDDKHAHQGSGLGLAIVSSYVQMLDGQVWLDSEQGQGATFYVSLPQQLNKGEMPAPLPKVNIWKGEAKNIKALIVEDDHISAMHMQTLVHALVKDIKLATNGIEAIEIFTKERDIDLILMDMKMPKLGGIEATKRIREFDKNVVIIAQTAFAFEEDKQKALEAGCTDYISKPIQKDKLFALFNRYFP